MRINVPANAPDSVNTVVVLETNGTMQTDSVRLLSANGVNNRLLAFDAELVGKGFGFGDGKTDKYYVNGWSKKDQLIKWNFRLIQPATYKVILKYLADNSDAGRYEIKIEGLVKTGEVLSSEKDEVKTINLGEVSLQPGTHTLQITPIEITKSGLMKILEVQLVPQKLSKNN